MTAGISKIEKRAIFPNNPDSSISRISFVANFGEARDVPMLLSVPRIWSGMASAKEYIASSTGPSRWKIIMLSRYVVTCVGISIIVNFIPSDNKFFSDGAFLGTDLSAE